MNGMLLLVAPVISGALLVPAFPPRDFSWLAWIALVPLLLALRGCTRKQAFLLAWIFGLVFFGGQFNWVFQVPKYKLYYHLLLLPFMGLYFGLFGLALSSVTRWWHTESALLTAPFIWVSIEYLRAHFFFLAVPWGLLAQSQYEHLRMIQYASYTGAYGVSFLVVLVNAAIAITILAFSPTLQKNRSSHNAVSRRKQAVLISLGAISLTALLLLYGSVRLSEPIEGKQIKIAVVQGDIAQDRKWDRSFATFIMKTYADLTQKASTEKPALIVWPETATPGSIGKDKKMYREVRRIAAESGTYLLIGSSQRQKFKGSESRRIKILNSAFLIPPDRTAQPQSYAKMRLFPFGEYAPMDGIFPWASIGVPVVRGFSAGKKFTVFQHPEFTFSAPICWETLFPGMIRRFVQKGAHVIVNITNEAWFGRSTAPYLFLSMNVFRAVENRRYLVRCANTGISCFIDPNGRIIDRVRNQQGEDVFVRGLLTGRVIPLNYKTFYTRYGDWFAWICVFCSTVFLVISIFRGKQAFAHFFSRHH